MNDSLLRFYHHSPYYLRVLLASAWGYYLRWWRYGPETDRLVEEALERETWTQEKWKNWQEERLAFVLNRAATQVPYYREQWAQRRSRGDRSPLEYLENWPFLEKEPLRQNPRAFVADDCDVRKMFPESTSGSTGTPLSLWQSHETVRAWYALVEARWRQWYGVSRHDRWAIIGGKKVAPPLSRKPPFWVWNAAYHQLYMSSYHLAPDLLGHYLEALRRHRIKYLLGYTSALHTLALEVLQTNAHDLQMAVVVTNAERLLEYQRETISRAFQCPVRETYGMSEAVAAAGECQCGSLHLWPEAGLVEVCTGSRPVNPGMAGDLICTGLLNMDMPLIRYRVRDRGTLESTGKTCTCNRTLPMLASLDGRSDDIIYTTDGRMMGQQIDTIFSTDMNIREAQIVQEKLTRIRVRYVPASNFSANGGNSIITGLRDHLGPVEVVLEPVHEIPRGANGKFRLVVCNLPPEEIKLLAQENNGS